MNWRKFLCWIGWHDGQWNDDGSLSGGSHMWSRTCDHCKHFDWYVG